MVRMIEPTPMPMRPSWKKDDERVVGEDHDEEQREVHRVAVQVLEDEQEGLALVGPVAGERADRAAGRRARERAIVGLPVVVTGEAEAAREDQDQHRGRGRNERRPPRLATRRTTRDAARPGRSAPRRAAANRTERDRAPSDSARPAAPPRWCRRRRSGRRRPSRPGARRTTDRSGSSRRILRDVRRSPTSGGEPWGGLYKEAVPTPQARNAQRAVVSRAVGPLLPPDNHRLAKIGGAFPRAAVMLGLALDRHLLAARVPASSWRPGVDALRADRIARRETRAPSDPVSRSAPSDLVLLQVGRDSEPRYHLARALQFLAPRRRRFAASSHGSRGSGVFWLPRLVRGPGPTDHVSRSAPGSNRSKMTLSASSGAARRVRRLRARQRPSARREQPTSGTLCSHRRGSRCRRGGQELSRRRRALHRRTVRRRASPGPERPSHPRNNDYSLHLRSSSPSC